MVVWDHTSQLAKTGCKPYGNVQGTASQLKQGYGAWTHYDPIFAQKKMVGCSKYMELGVHDGSRKYFFVLKQILGMAARQSIIFTQALSKVDGCKKYSLCSKNIISRSIIPGAASISLSQVCCISWM